jgi:hypothetical protein
MYFWKQILVSFYIGNAFQELYICWLIIINLSIIKSFCLVQIIKPYEVTDGAIMLYNGMNVYELLLDLFIKFN